MNAKLKNLLDGLSDSKLNLLVSGNEQIKAGLTTEDGHVAINIGSAESWFTISGSGFSFSDWLEE